MSLQAATALFKAAMFSILLHNHKQNVRFLAASCNSCKRPYTYSRLPHTRHLDHSKPHKPNANQAEISSPKETKNQKLSSVLRIQQQQHQHFRKTQLLQFPQTN
jgi:hypothetical protein